MTQGFDKPILMGIGQIGQFKIARFTGDKIKPVRRRIDQMVNFLGTVKQINDRIVTVEAKFVGDIGISEITIDG